ncbi:uncharacterized protein LOC114365326 [Ostrinia furnacalis]|uniref:uncharacterized protein LOC114365326 n=1 Tax=Ostrinia furnacalis TaxID=93504 RepID=UPI00103CF611|nr:uncharacterized protein LOC114365326 [Ostrinia furnacalis]
MKQLSSSTEATGRSKFTRKLWNDNNEANIWRPSKIMYRSTQTSTESPEPSIDLRTWPTVPWIYLQSRSTTELLTVSPPTQPNSASRRSWRPHFPTAQRFTFINPIYWNLESAQRPFTQQSLNVSRNATVQTTSTNPKVTEQTTVFNYDYQLSGNLTTSYEYYDTTIGNTGMMLRIIFNDDTKKAVTARRKIHKARTGARRSSDSLPVSCYECGINQPSEANPPCYDVFDSPDQRYRNHKRNMITMCYDNYMNGCVKRFLDVGSKYLERTCRNMPPKAGTAPVSGIVHERLRYLETMLDGINSGCVMSPYAVATPFTQRWSLFTRYHVCICTGDLCNSATSLRVDYLVDK